MTTKPLIPETHNSSIDKQKESIDRGNYSIDTVHWARNQALDVISYILKQAEVPEVYEREISRMSTYQDIYNFLDTLMLDDGNVRAWVERILSFDRWVQREFMLGYLGKTKLNLSAVQLWNESTKVDTMVIANIDEKWTSYDDVKDDDNVLSMPEFWNLSKKLWIWDNFRDFTRFCIEILWMREGQKYRLRDSRRGKANIVYIADEKVISEPDLRGKDSDLLPALKKWNNDEFEIHKLQFSEMPDQSIPEQNHAQSIFDSMRDWEWKNDIVISKGTVFFKELWFWVLLFDTHIQLREEIDETVVSRFDWSEISKYLYNNWLSREERMVFYTGVMQMSVWRKYKTSTMDKWFPVCVEFDADNLTYYTDTDNDGSLPMRKKVYS